MGDDMRVTIATTTGFHLRRLAYHLQQMDQHVEYFSYMPRYRLAREGMRPPWSHSLFRATLPGSALALSRGQRWQRKAVERMLAKTDEAVSKRLNETDVFVGLSAMAVKSAERARSMGATVFIDRGSRHVLSQNALITDGGGKPLSQFYIERELASYEEADHIMTLSQHSADSFVERGFDPSRIHVNPLGVDLRQFTQTDAPPSSTPRLIYVGNWSVQKGVDLLTWAMSERPEWRLTWVGVASVSDAAERPSQLLRKGYLTHDELAREMADHHVLVLPSRQDGFGMVLLEALAAGLTVVGSTMTGAPDIKLAVDGSASVQLFAAGDRHDLLRALDTAVAHSQTMPEGRRRRSLDGNHLDYFSWAAYAERYRRILRRVVSAQAD